MSLYATLAHLSADELQALVLEHAISSSTGRCLSCDTLDCASRTAALAELAGRGTLPRRSPGSTQPERVGARRVSPHV